MPVAKGTSWTIKSMYQATKHSSRWRCAGCGCTTRKACSDGCTWAAPKLCSRCLCTPLQLAALLATVWGNLKVMATADEVAAWPQVEQARANRWLQANYHFQAQARVVRRGPKPKGPKMPRFLAKALATLPAVHRSQL